MPNAHGDINHVLQLRNNLCAPCKPPQVVTSIAVIMFNVYRVSFADNMSFRRQNFGKRIPVVSVKNTVF
jgi:hypothetical protein